MKQQFILFFLVLSVVTGSADAQINCSTTDIAKVPGKWVWEKAGQGAQWQLTEPIRKELQRVFPGALDGLHATNSIAFGNQKAFWYTNSPAAYENYLMLRKYECLKGKNILQPEGETGCWVYFSVNQIDGMKFPLPEAGTEMVYHAYESKIRVTNIEVKKDANGNKILYCSYRPEETLKHCYFFSMKNDLPWRKLSNKELYTTYKLYHEKRLTAEITRTEKTVRDYEMVYNALSDAEKQKGDYRSQQYLNGVTYLNKIKKEKESIQAWYNKALLAANANNAAYVKKLDSYNFKPEELEAPAGSGYNVWVDNLEFFDKTKPKDAVQCIAMYIRRQDGDQPKKNFMDQFFSKFNLDVLAKMTGEPAKRPDGINTITASETTAKNETKANQSSTAANQYDLGTAAAGQFPSGWNGMKNITVQSYQNSNWLAMTKDGYWYPQQYNKEIKDNFSLSFDLSWNKDIAYNSGLFTLCFAEIPYENASESYKMDNNQRQYWSLYDSYAGNFNRVMIWFDPNWNGGGTMEVYSYDRNESVVTRKRIVLPGFFQEKNSHQLKILRQGDALVFTLDDKKEAEIANVFLSNAKYNLYTFSRYKGNNSDNKSDVFYLKNVKTQY